MTTPEQTIETGGPAVPSRNIMHTGMTLRDYFAAKALPSVINYWQTSIHLGGEDFDMEKFSFEIAIEAYDMADSMIAARKGRRDADGDWVTQTSDGN